MTEPNEEELQALVADRPASLPDLFQQAAQWLDFTDPILAKLQVPEGADEQTARMVRLVRYLASGSGMQADLHKLADWYAAHPEHARYVYDEVFG